MSVTTTKKAWDSRYAGPVPHDISYVISPVRCRKNGERIGKGRASKSSEKKKNV